MQRLQHQAASRSGIPGEKAFALDDAHPSIYARIGRETFVKLSTNFYNRVYADDEHKEFKEIFAGSEKADAIQNQYEFFIQRMGGPPLYSQRKGHPALIGRHANFRVDADSARRWLHHMSAALDETPGIDKETRELMWNFLSHTAWFLVAGQEMMNPKQAASAPAKPAVPEAAAASAPEQSDDKSSPQPKADESTE